MLGKKRGGSGSDINNFGSGSLRRINHGSGTLVHTSAQDLGFYLDVPPAVHHGHGGGGRGGRGRGRAAARAHRHLVQVARPARPARARQAERDSVVRSYEICNISKHLEKTIREGLHLLIV